MIMTRSIQIRTAFATESSTERRRDSKVKLYEESQLTLVLFRNELFSWSCRPKKSESQ